MLARPAIVRSKGTGALGTRQRKPCVNLRTNCQLTRRTRKRTQRQNLKPRNGQLLIVLLESPMFLSHTPLPTVRVSAKSARMDIAKAPNGKPKAPIGTRRAHRPSSLSQSVDVQCVNHQALLALAKDFGSCTTTAERMIVADSLAKMTAAWRVATAERREIHNRPRAGQLSPAERAEMRRAKSSRSRKSAPKLSAKESVISGPTVHTVPGGGGAA